MTENITEQGKNAQVTEASEPVYVAMLGRFEIRSGEGSVSDDVNRSMKMWNFLAYIITHRNKKISHDEFFEMLWNGEESDNPLSALKTLLYRIRVLLEPVDGKGDFIISQRGSYCFNPDIKVVLDVEQFERLCRRAAQAEVSEDEQVELLGKAVRMYKGDFLNKLSNVMWVVPLQTRYHSLYLSAVYKLAELLIQRGAYEEAAEYCSRALQIDSMDEKLYCLFISALLKKGDSVGALKQYKVATDLLYRSLGVRPSEELRSLYSDIVSAQKNAESDLATIMDDLREAAGNNKAFFCEYSFFREIYRLEARRVSRLGLPVFIGLVTVGTAGKVPPAKSLIAAMDKLGECILGCLRRGDVVSKYSSSQYVLLLPALTFEDGEMVMNRIITAFNKTDRRSWMEISYKLQEIELPD